MLTHDKPIRFNKLVVPLFVVIRFIISFNKTVLSLCNTKLVFRNV